jgi:hypothetical protein
LEDVRGAYASETQNRPSPSVKSALIAERRTEIAKNDFFQKPPPAPEPPEHEQGMALLMV